MIKERPIKEISGSLKGALGRIASYKLEIKSVLEASVLCLVMVLAIIFRVLPIRWGAYFTAYDPLFQFRVTKYIVENGYAAYFSWHDNLSWYPMGRDISHSSFPGLPFSAAFLYQLLRGLGFNFSLHDVCLFFPILMACITCIVVYFLGRDLGGKGVGIFAAFFMAISAAFISRTSLGFFDTENIGIFGIAFTSLFFLRSIELKNPPKRRLVYAIAAGLSLAYLHASWGASRYVAGLLTLFMFVSILGGMFERRYLVSFTITMGIGYMFALLVPKLGFKFLLSIENIAILGFMLFLFIYDAIRGRVQTGKLLLITGLMLTILVGGVFALESFGIIGSISNKFISVLDPSRRSQNALLESVAEHRRSVWVNFFVDFGLTMSLSVFGSYLALRKLDYKRLFGILLFLSSLYFAGSMIRLTLILSIPVSLMAAFGLNELVKPFVSVVSRGTQRRSKRRTRFFGVSREMGAIFTVFILIATLPTVWSAADSANRPGSLASSGGVGTHDWLQALSWMKDNLPEDAVVVSWWDYGYWIETLSNKTTLADGATRNTTQIARIARIMLNNHSESLLILQKYDATHILVFQTFDPGNPENKFGLGEWGKWLPMARIGGFNESEYYDFRTGSGFTEKFHETTLARLMNMQADPDHFKIAFASVNLFVLVYEIIY